MKPWLKSNRIVRCEPLDGYRLRLVFSDGYVGEVDLTPALRGPIFEPLRESGLFRQVAVDGSSIRWPNEADFCPDVLRCWCEHGHVMDPAETDAAFADREEESLVLREDPPHA